MMQFFKTLFADDSGQDLIEYALVAALMGIAAVSALKVLNNTIGNSFSGVDNSLNNAVPQGNAGH